MFCRKHAFNAISALAKGILHGSFRPVSTASKDTLPLSGVRVLELGHLVAGPFAGQLLAHFGADVIKIEPPKTGDPLRVWRELDIDGTSLWFRSLGRNKKSVAIDLRKDEGRDLVRRLAIKSDVIIENFKPGTLEKWKMGPESLHAHNPSLIYTRLSGYGQSGSWSHKAGYASVCEAEAGFRYVNGFPDIETGELDGPPVRPNISLGDSVAGLHAAFGTVLALLAKEGKNRRGEKGTVVDVSIVESMMNLMEGIIPEYDRKGVIRGPSGSSVTGIVPTNAYPCLPSSTAEATYVIIGANNDTLYNKLMTAISRPDLIGPLYAQNNDRVIRQAEIEGAIKEWTRGRSVHQVVSALDQVGIPVGRVRNVKDLMEDKDSWISDRNVEQVLVKNEAKSTQWTVKMPRVFPLLVGLEAETRTAGPDLGAHTDEVLLRELGLSQESLNLLRTTEVIG